MKLSSIRVDVAAVEAGEWIGDLPGMGDLRILTRGAGNADWKRMRSKLLRATTQADMDGEVLTVDAEERINRTLLLECGILDWDNLTDDADKPVKFTKEVAREYLSNPELDALFRAAMIAATRVGRNRKAAVENLEKN